MNSPFGFRTYGRLAFAAALVIVGASGCKSKQDAAIEHAKQQAASTGQPQQVISTDKDGNTVTTVVQPPEPGQKGEVVTTTVTPKPAAGTPAAATNGAADSSGSAAPSSPAGSGATPASQTAAAPAPPPPPPPVDVPAGTELAIRVDQRLSAKGSRPGEKFTGEIVTPVKDGSGNDVIPKGSRVTGVVDEAHKRGHFKGAATLELRLTSLTLGGREYPLETADLRERKKGKGKRTAGMIGGGAGLGMLIGGVASGGTGLIIGGLAGAGAGTAGAGLTGNRDLVIPAESIVHFKLKDDLQIQP
ncbi:hypothetical protein [Acidicapsa acidisoli]|uniref:hypothetical protein n=1 Tax=Acidicapsa acidisoli TaxID=1615681 RepID=UPI0021E0AD99|nr:hypothetical protein [Acidicapsa acidisoli]